MLPLHVIALHLLAKDAKIMGDAKSSKASVILSLISIGLIIACIYALALSWLERAS